VDAVVVSGRAEMGGGVGILVTIVSINSECVDMFFVSTHGHVLVVGGVVGNKFNIF
jgi:hypothetical protein